MPPTKQDQTPLQMAIIRYLQDKPFSTSKEMATSLAYHPRTVYEACKELVEKGKLITQLRGGKGGAYTYGLASHKAFANNIVVDGYVRIGGHKLKDRVDFHASRRVTDVSLVVRDLKVLIHSWAYIYKLAVLQSEGEEVTDNALTLTRTNLEGFRSRVSDLLCSIDETLNDKRLWDTRQLAKALVLNDLPQLDLSTVDQTLDLHS